MTSYRSRLLLNHGNKRMEMSILGELRHFKHFEALEAVEVFSKNMQ